MDQWICTVHKSWVNCLHISTSFMYADFKSRLVLFKFSNNFGPQRKCKQCLINRRTERLKLVFNLIFLDTSLNYPKYMSYRTLIPLIILLHTIIREHIWPFYKHYIIWTDNFLYHNGNQVCHVRNITFLTRL